MLGNEEFNVIVCALPVAPMLNSIVSAPRALFASPIAWRNEPAPASFVLVTV